MKLTTAGFRPAIRHVHQSFGEVQKRVMRVELRIERAGIVPFNRVDNLHCARRSEKREKPGLLVNFVALKKRTIRSGDNGAARRGRDKRNRELDTAHSTRESLRIDFAEALEWEPAFPLRKRCFSGWASDTLYSMVAAAGRAAKPPTSKKSVTM